MHEPSVVFTVLNSCFYLSPPPSLLTYFPYLLLCLAPPPPPPSLPTTTMDVEDMDKFLAPKTTYKGWRGRCMWSFEDGGPALRYGEGVDLLSESRFSLFVSKRSTCALEFQHNKQGWKVGCKPQTIRQQRVVHDPDCKTYRTSTRRPLDHSQERCPFSAIVTIGRRQSSAFNEWFLILAG
jgi:hypothetical protein